MAAAQHVMTGIALQCTMTRVLSLRPRNAVRPMLRYRFFVTPRPVVPAEPDTLVTRRPSAATPPPPLPAGVEFLQVGQGWRTVLVNPVPFDDLRHASAVEASYPGGSRRWMVCRGKTAHNAGLNASRRELRCVLKLAAYRRGERRRAQQPREPEPTRLTYNWELVLARALRAYALVSTDQQQAIAVARTIPSAAVRDYCVAAIARGHVLPADLDTLLRETLTAAAYRDWSYTFVRTFCTLLEPLRDDGSEDAQVWLRFTASALLEVAETEAAPFRRGECQSLVEWFLGDRHPDLRRSAAVAAIDSFLLCRPGWKRDRRLRRLATQLNALDHEEALRGAGHIANGRLRRQVLRRIDAAIVL